MSVRWQSPTLQSFDLGQLRDAVVPSLCSVQSGFMLIPFQPTWVFTRRLDGKLGLQGLRIEWGRFLGGVVCVDIMEIWIVVTEIGSRSDGVVFGNGSKLEEQRL